MLLVFLFARFPPSMIMARGVWAASNLLRAETGPCGRWRLDRLAGVGTGDGNSLVLLLTLNHGSMLADGMRGDCWR